MIQLNVDFGLLNTFLGLTTSKIIKYAGKTLEEIVNLEKFEGNEKAENFNSILSNPDKIFEIFKLANVQNKYIILQNLSENDLDDLIPFLTPEQMSEGLFFFHDDKLMALINEVPSEEVSEVVLKAFSIFDILKLMGESTMDKFLKEPDVERKYSQKYFESLPPDALKKLLTQTVGEDFENKSQSECIDYLKDLKDSEFQKFILSLERKNKINLIGGIIEQKKELVNLFDSKELTKPMNTLMKSDKIKIMSKLDPKFLAPMIKELPVELTQIVLTQIDPKIFAKIITEDFKNILSSAVIFSSK